MTLPSLVPPAVMRGSVHEREAYFSAVVVLHANLNAAYTKLSEFSADFDAQRLILLVGAAGVGKTSLLELLVTRHFALRKEKMAADRRCIPALFVELEPPVAGKFTFKPFYREALGLMNAPAINKTLPIAQKHTGRNQILGQAVETNDLRASGEDLKTRFRTNLIDRQVELVVLDEAIFAFEIGASKSRLDRLDHVITQANHLRSFVNKTPTTFVLAGAYDFFELTVSTSQLARRSSIVHFEPYSPDSKGLDGFTGALIELLRHLPIEHTLDPMMLATPLYLQSLGCIGNLKDILKRALKLALRRGRSVDDALLRECYLTPPALEAIRRDMFEGSEKLTHFLSSVDLAEVVLKASIPARPSLHKKPKLKPGEMKPSFRREATDQWDT